MVEFIGLSGPIKFDTSGLRTQFAMDLMELQMGGLVNIEQGSDILTQNLFQTKVGTWNTLDRLGMARSEEEKANNGIADPMANKTFVICGFLVSPTE